MSFQRTKPALGWWWWLLFAMAAAGFIILSQFAPADSSWYPKCMLHAVTGLHCPGCGTTRALRALATGRPLLAVQCNPLLLIGGPVIAFALWHHSVKGSRENRSSARLAWILFGVILTYSILRNVPSPTTSWLAPPSAQQVQ